MEPNSYNTKLLCNDENGIAQAAKLIASGEVVGMPTETVYGLAANALDENAVKKIFIAKGRPADNPLIVHIAELDDIFTLCHDIPENALKIAKALWPAPLTLILPKKDIVPYVTSGGLDTVGVRMPCCQSALKLIKKSGKPLAAPSANTSGKPSPTNAMHVFDDMQGKISAIIDGGECSVGVESTVICFENDNVRILRPGFVTPNDLAMFCNDVIIDKNVLQELDENARAASPGMKYKHYSPKCDVFLVESTSAAFFEYAKNAACENDCLMIFDGDINTTKIKSITYGANDIENAERIFNCLRKTDELGAEHVFVRAPSKNGVGLAVYNRLIRAAGFKVIKLN